jgi:tetratricopeptide (TPR) repeat protein
MLNHTPGDLGAANKLLSNATLAYRNAQFPAVLDQARQALALIEATSAQDNTRAVLLDSAYKRIVETLDRTNQFEEARQVLTQWQQVTSRSEGHVDCLALWARISYRQGNYDQALQFIDEGSTLAQAVGYAAGLAALLRFRADVFWMRGQAEQALSLASRALSLYERLGDQEGQSRTLNTMAAIHHMLGNYYRSIKYSLRAITILRTINDQMGLRIVYSNIGEAYQQIYAMKTALYYHSQALQMSGSNPSPDLLRNLGVDMVAVGRTEEGLSHLLEALEKSRAQGDTDAIMLVLHSLADAVFAIEQIAEAQALALELLTVAKPLNAGRHIIRARLILGNCARAEGDEAKAQEYFREGFLAAQQAADKSIIWQTHAALAEMLADSAPEQAAEHARIAAEMVTSIMLAIEDKQLQETFRSAPIVARVLSLRQEP